MPLKIVFLGWSLRLTDQYMEQMAEDNAEQVAWYNRRYGRLVLTDGTEITNAYHMNRIQGRRFDQVIVADDRRMEILEYHQHDIAELLACCMASPVPEEYRLQTYDLDAEE